MKPPSAPKKPVKPQAPPQEITMEILEFLDTHEDKTLATVLEESFPGISLDKIKVVCEKQDNGYCQDYDWSMGLQYSWRQEDPKYSEKMTKYHSQLEKYEEAWRQYKLDVEEYKQKLKGWHEAQLKNLTL